MWKILTHKYLLNIVVRDEPKVRPKSVGVGNGEREQHMGRLSHVNSWLARLITVDNAKHAWCYGVTVNLRLQSNFFQTML